MKIEQISISEISLDKDNARTHNDRNIKALEGSLARFGQRKPIVLTQNKVVVAGNGTLTAAKNLGWEKIDAVFIPDTWTASEIKAFALADNRIAELADWNRSRLVEQLVELETLDFQLEALGFTPVDTADFARINSATSTGVTDALKEWVGMPEYSQEDKNSFFHCTVHFKNQEDVEKFFAILNTKKSKSFWWPESDGLVGSNVNEQYVVEVNNES